MKMYQIEYIDSDGNKQTTSELGKDEIDASLKFLDEHPHKDYVILNPDGNKSIPQWKKRMIKKFHSIIRGD